MYDNAIKILNIIELNGYEAYIVGGYVRNKILGIKSNDIDITTSAKPNELLRIFPNAKVIENYGCVKLIYNNFKYEITTYRKDFDYSDFRRPSNIEYTKILKEDLLRRDFTINTLCINSEGKIIDLLGGNDDINNKIIKTVGEPKEKIAEDALRILRAIRFASTLGFSIESNLLLEIRKQVNIVSNLSFDRRKLELNNIFKSQNLNDGINMINELNLDKILEIEAENNIKYCDNVLGIWAQINFSSNYNFSKQEKIIINEIRYLLKNKNITIVDVYKFKKESIYSASQILDVDKVIIDNLYNDLKIHSRTDINITYDEIISNIKVSDNQINKIYMDLEYKILYNNLENKNDAILCYLKSEYAKR